MVHSFAGSRTLVLIAEWLGEALPSATHPISCFLNPIELILPSVIKPLSNIWHVPATALAVFDGGG